MHRDEFLIHASKKFYAQEFSHALRLMRLLHGDDFSFHRFLQSGADMPILFGGVVGQSKIIDMVNANDEEHAIASSPWFNPPDVTGGGYGWVLADSKPVPFVPYKGQLGLFEVDWDALRQVS